jgi:hypothetical protein
MENESLGYGRKGLPIHLSFLSKQKLKKYGDCVKQIFGPATAKFGERRLPAVVGSLPTTSQQQRKFSPSCRKRQAAACVPQIHDFAREVSACHRNELVCLISPQIAAQIKTKVRDCETQSPDTRDACATRAERAFRARRITRKNSLQPRKRFLYCASPHQ